MNVVDMHSSFLVLNSVVGCSNGCKYCLLQDRNQNLCAPKELTSPETAIQYLLKFEYYDSSIPLCLFPNTDIFLNSFTLHYLVDVLQEIEKQSIQNDLVFITKCFIPTFILDILSDMRRRGRNIVFYLSFSGLDKDVEPYISPQNIQKNFENLQAYSFPIVHYYRPFLPQNSNTSQIKNMLNYVHQYTNISAIMGLMYVPGMIEQNTLWNYLRKYDEEELNRAISIWPEEAWDYFYKSYDEKQYFYQTNTCALSAALNKPSLQYYGTYECKNLNHCSKRQRKICMSSSSSVSQDILLEKLTFLLEKLNISGHYNYTFDVGGGIELDGIRLDVKTLSFLSYMLKVKVSSKVGDGINHLYNSTLNGGKYLILRKDGFLWSK